MKLHGFIAGDTFGNKGNSHFADLNGNVICGSKNRFGMDCSMKIEFKSITEFKTDEWNTANMRKRENTLVDAEGYTPAHLPLDVYISCKRCQKILEKKLGTLPDVP